ncbi:MAG: peptidoglycan endopeptidase [Sphingomonadaceae bacterium]|nr:peptidoglycan endopeptidase [Sphingomonadaceae bacterium]
MSAAEVIVARARGCVGARFRLHGRDRAHGLDCIGLAAHATGLPAPCGYALRGGSPERLAAGLAAAGLAPTAAPGAGDLLLVTPGPAQFHLIVLTGTGFVHADAGLRRVVETPGSPRWPVLGAWRLALQGE